MAYLVALSLLVAPLYVWRFGVGGVPLNFLLLWMIILWAVFLAWLIKRRAVFDFARYKLSLPKPLLILGTLFLLAGLVSLFYGGLTQDKLGQFIVIFIQPLSLFFIAGYVAKEEPSTRHMFRQTAYFMVALMGLLAVIQYFTLTTLPEVYWGNSNEPKRAVGLFGHPDMFGLFLTPFLAWLIPDVLRRLDDWRNKVSYWSLGAWVLGCAGLLLCLSRGAWFGFAAAALVGIIAYGRKKYWALGLLAVIITGSVIAAVPNLRYRIILPFMGEKSSVARLSLWSTGQKMIEASPIFGQGLHGFNQKWFEFNTDPNLDHYNSPHNFVLNFWIDTGLLGLVSFIGIVLYGWWYGFRNRHKPYALGLALFLVALTVHGLIDTPYLKNDLAMIFWLIWGISYERT